MNHTERALNELDRVYRCFRSRFVGMESTRPYMGVAVADNRRYVLDVWPENVDGEPLTMYDETPKCGDCIVGLRRIGDKISPFTVQSYESEDNATTKFNYCPICGRRL